MADPLDDRLRDLARDTEPLIVLAGPADIRRRGERRRARRRTGAVAVVAVAALAVASWVVAPRLETGAQPPAVGTSPLPDPLPTQVLNDELLPSTALPRFSYWHWRAVSYDISAKIPLMKCDPALYDPASASVRSYQGNQSSSARYVIRALRDGATAAGELARIGDQLGKCGLMSSYGVGPEGKDMKTVLRGYGFTNVDGQLSQVWLAAEGQFVSLLQVVTPATANTQPETPDTHSEYPDLDPVKCMTVSLDRLARSAGPSATVGAGPSTPDGTGAPTPPSAATGGSSSGPQTPPAGGGTTTGKPLNPKFPPGYVPPISPDRC